MKAQVHKLTGVGQTVFFGANDACVPGHDQHVPIDKYKENLKTIIQHPATLAQNPRIILISPPPVNEYQLEAFDAAKDTPHPSRTASFTKLYAAAALEVAASLNVPVVDLWSAFMQPTGWQEGQPLIGSRDAPNNETFAGLFTDGTLLPAGFLSLCLLVPQVCICRRLAAALSTMRL